MTRTKDEVTHSDRGQPQAHDLLAGRWFDGLSSRPRPVVVRLRPSSRGPSLELHPLSAPGEAPRVFTCEQVGWPPAWNARTPPPRVVVDLRDHGSLEIDAVADWRAALSAAGDRPGIAQRMQNRWSVLLCVAVTAAVGLSLFYRYGTPWAATHITRFVPLHWETSVAENVLREMDDGTLQPSQLPLPRQEQLQARFDTLVQQIPTTLHRYAGYRPPLSLEFRAGMGANAFALPGGKVVLTDGIVKAAAQSGLPDDALVGVLAHEIGHVVHRHSTRMVVEQGVLNMGLGLALGDVSVLVSTGASVLTGLAYSRSHEREADCYAMALMRHASLPTAPMGQLLLAIAHDEEDDAKNREKTPEQSPESRTDNASAPQSPPRDSAAKGSGRGDAKVHPVWSLLSSHPGTVQRATELVQGHTPHCDKG